MPKSNDRTLISWITHLAEVTRSTSLRTREEAAAAPMVRHVQRRSALHGEGAHRTELRDDAFKLSCPCLLLLILSSSLYSSTSASLTNSCCCPASASSIWPLTKCMLSRQLHLAIPAAIYPLSSHSSHLPDHHSTPIKRQFPHCINAASVPSI